MRKFYGPPIPGSISPVPATDDMTEPVGIRDGQLFTKSGGDAGLETRVENLENDVAGLYDDIHDADGGLDSRVTDLETEVNDPSTGLDARVTALEQNPGQTYTAGAGIDITAGAISFAPNVVDIGTISLTDGHASTPFAHSDFNAVNPSTMIRAYINGRYVQARMTGYYQNPDEDPNTYLFCGVNGAYAYVFTMNGITDIIEVQEYALVELPSGGTEGQVLIMGADGPEWASVQGYMYRETIRGENLLTGVISAEEGQ